MSLSSVPPQPDSCPRRVATVPDERWLDLWPPGNAPLDVVLWPMDGPPPVAPDLVVVPYQGGPGALPRLAEVPGVQVVQLLTAGFEGVAEHLPAGARLCNAAGVHDTSTAELAVALALAALRGLGEFARAQFEGRWAVGTRPALADRRVLIVGAGGVGEAIRRRLDPFEVTVTRVASRARDDEHGRVHEAAELNDLLPAHDVVILACPLTPATRGLVDAAFLARMPDGALLVNVSRGPVVVTDDLLDVVRTGRLRAALDVTDPEPLPPGHPLWTAPGVLISPHVGGDTSAFPPRGRALLRDQFERFAAGRPLRHCVAGPAGQPV